MYLFYSDNFDKINSDKCTYFIQIILIVKDLVPSLNNFSNHEYIYSGFASFGELHTTGLHCGVLNQLWR